MVSKRVQQVKITGLEPDVSDSKTGLKILAAIIANKMLADRTADKNKE